ncbi:MAG: DNA primase [Candidatus Poribacteria bacterium]|nr:DNA primase [Candidatus Poribacteria bacterium]
MASGRIAPATLDKIRSRIDLVRLVEDVVGPMRRSGKNFMAKCPFHQDDSPSFSVSPEKQLYHCFGCGASGTAFTFLQQRENIPFNEAVRKLAARAGVEVKELEGDPLTSEEQSVAAANRYAREHFHEWLMNPSTGKSAQEYLIGRGITVETMKELQLGYVPDGWDNLMKVMLRADFDAETLLQAGLIRRNEQGREYDYFRHRIIFPINNLHGEVVAFGGRAMDDDSKPKYLNSPETPLYKKGEILYFLDRARKEISDSRRALITEGYMDVISLYQHGIVNAVASLGTALTDSHARVLKRYTDEVIFVFDGDEAGSRAVSRGAPHFLREGFRANVVVLPEGVDPDDFVQKNGTEAFNARVDDALPLVEFQLRQAAKDADLTDAEVKIEIIGEIAELLRHVQNPILMKDYAQRVADGLDLHIQDVWSELRRHRVSLRTPPPPKSAQEAVGHKPRLAVERQLLTCLLNAPQKIGSVFDQIGPGDFVDVKHQELAKILWQTDRDQEDATPQRLMEVCFDDDVRGLIAELMIEARSLPDIESATQGCVTKMVGDTLRQMERQHLESTSKGEEIDELELAKELLELSQNRREFRQTQVERERARIDQERAEKARQRKTGAKRDPVEQPS